MTDTDQTDTRDEVPENEVDSTPETQAEAPQVEERSVDEELDAILADFRSGASEKPETQEPKDVSLEDRLKRVEEQERKRLEEQRNKEISDRLDQAAADMIKAVPDLERITKSGVRGTLIGDLYQDPGLLNAFLDQSSPQNFKKLCNTLAKRYASGLPKHEQTEKDDTAAVLAEVRGVSTKPPSPPNEADFARNASSGDFWAKYGSVLHGR